MELGKNSQLISNICQVLIRSIDDTSDIPALQAIYYTPSKIQYSKSGRRTEAGNLYTQTLSLSYPGLSQLDFSKFDEILRGAYQVYLKLDNGEYYEVAPDYFPMQVETQYNLPDGHQLRFFSTSPYGIRYVATETEENPDPLGILFNYELDFNLA